MTSGWYMSDTNWDAIKIKPQRRIRIVGCGVFGPTGHPPSKPAGWKLEFRIHVDGEQKDTFIYVSAEDQWEEEDRFYKNIFREHGG